MVMEFLMVLSFSPREFGVRHLPACVLSFSAMLALLPTLALVQVVMLYYHAFREVVAERLRQNSLWIFVSGARRLLESALLAARFLRVFASSFLLAEVLAALLLVRVVVQTRLFL